MQEENIHDYILRTINDALSTLGWEQALAEEVYLSLPTDARFGDLSTNLALRLAKSLKRPPRDIASEFSAILKERIKSGALSKYVTDVKVEGGGFINFYFAPGFFGLRLSEILLRQKDALGMNRGRGRRLLIEFVSANPTGPLSVAHARQAAVGDALANILGFSGFAAEKEYYLNDEGNQINILGNSIALRLKEIEGEKTEFPENHYQGEYIYDIARQLKDRGRKVTDFSEYGVDHILDIIKQELKDFGVVFDSWYSQKELRKSGRIGKALDFLKDKGLLYEEEGALWFKSTQFGDDKDRVVIKSDGSYTYLAPDIAYHQDKIERGFQSLINLWGPDHHGYINRLKAAVEALGASPQMLSIIIVQLASIFREGKPVQMSTRKGQYITLREVLDEVGRDAARFFFLMRRTSSHLDFDLDIAKKQTSENPVFYVQYAHARIWSILRNNPGATDLKDADFTLLKEAEEAQLMKKIWQFSYVLEACVSSLDPYMLTVYVQELAEEFHRFYDRHRVLGQAKALTEARLGLIKSVQIVIAVCLELLGVSAPQEM